MVTWSALMFSIRTVRGNVARLALACLFVLSGAPAPADDGGREFALHDGDTVVFLGDSITAARTYGKIIENYTLLRFPDRRIRFLNAGKGGDTAQGGLRRLDSDVLSAGATVVTVAYGVNDIGWGLKADEEHRQQYLEGIRSIVSACRARNVRVFVCSAAVTAADPESSEESFLQQMCDEGMRLSCELGGEAIDVQRAMREIQGEIKRANMAQPANATPATLHAADGVHLNELGQLAMACAILRGLGAPADVSSATIDCNANCVGEATGCQISEWQATAERVEFTRKDEGLPFNYGIFFPLHYRFVPVPETLNRYLLRVQGLAAGEYEITADGRVLGVFSAEQLAQGVNLASATADAWQPGGPWDVQASVLKALTDARHELATAGALARAYASPETLAATLAAPARSVDEQLVLAQRDIARPRPYRFLIARSQNLGSPSRVK